MGTRGFALALIIVTSPAHASANAYGLYTRRERTTQGHRKGSVNLIGLIRVSDQHVCAASKGIIFKFYSDGLWLLSCIRCLQRTRQVLYVNVLFMN